ncbi:YopX family protein [Lactiplantibacillus plantarum]|uniref:YopX family protein n=1 Tax=Lactiplantibacillus plantarum TaxID=1590 RepID=UPI003D815546
MIKFRAWNGYRKIMADYVSAIQNGDTQGTPSSVNVIVNRKNETWDIKNDDVELLQFTGLKDKQGVEIYNGDILHFGSVWCVGDEYDPREEEHIGAVEYRPDYASYVVNCNGKIFPLEQVISFDGYSVEGNVHDNVEVTENEL